MQRLLTVPLSVLIALVGLALFSVACGSGDSTPQPSATETETSQRADRQATVLEQQQQQEAAIPVADDQADQQADDQADDQAEAEQQAEQAAAEQQVEAPQETSDDQQVVALPEDVVGEHKGVRSERNVLGDPDASVEILYYGDFT